MLETLDKLQSVHRRLSPEQRGPHVPTHADAVVIVRVWLVCILHQRSVTDLLRQHEKDSEMVAKHVAGAEAGPAPARHFGGAPWCEEGFDLARHKGMMGLLRQTKHAHVQHQVNVGVLEYELELSKRFTKVTGPALSMMTLQIPH